MNLKFTLLPLLCLTLVFSGCVDVSKKINNIKTSLLNNPSSEEYITPVRHPIKLPAHAKFVISAIIQTMRHKPLQGIKFDPSGKHDIVENFDYHGFEVLKIDIAKSVVLQSNKKRSIIDLGGFIYFQDQNFRSTVVSFEAAYRIDNYPSSTPIILASAATNLLPDFPIIATYFVPLEKVKKAKKSQFKTFCQLLDFARKNSLNMKLSSPDTAGVRQQEKLMNLTTFVFCFDRLSSSVKLNLSLKNPQGTLATIKPITLDYDGWRVMSFSGRCSLFSADKSFSLNVSYQSSSNPFAASKHIGSFSSLRTSPTRSTNRVTTAPIENGQRFLNLSQIRDAKIVQTRLMQLGYYKMTVDGKFGKGSKTALSKWSSETLGEPFLSYTMSLQKQLFKGTGL